MPYTACRNVDRCQLCNTCSEIVACPGVPKSFLEDGYRLSFSSEFCIGCGACVLACPNQAIELMESDRKGKVVIEVDGELRSVPEKVSVKEALQGMHHFSTLLPGEGVYAPCGVGACWSCAMEIDGELKPTCVTEVKEGMRIMTKPGNWTPRRIVGQYQAIPVGGVGTPNELRKYPFPIEAACMVAGCNFRCPECQNWFITFKGKGKPSTPRETAEVLVELKERANVNRMLISGGECTINMPWLVQCIKEIRELEPKSRIHISTNGSLLTEDYIDELVEVGLTDIGIDIKGLELDTFMKVTGLDDEGEAFRCKENAWHAVDYISNRYGEKVFLGLGVIYNRELVSLDEIGEIGGRIRNINPSIQVTAVDYRGEYRSRIGRPSLEEMISVHKLLRGKGLTTVFFMIHPETVGYRI